MQMLAGHNEWIDRNAALKRPQTTSAVVAGVSTLTSVLVITSLKRAKIHTVVTDFTFDAAAVVTDTGIITVGARVTGIGEAEFIRQRISGITPLELLAQSYAVDIPLDAGMELYMRVNVGGSTVNMTGVVTVYLTEFEGIQ